MTIKEQILLRICEKVYGTGIATVSMDELYDDETISAYVRNISIDSPFQDLLFSGILSVVNEQDNLVVSFTHEGYYHYILSRYLIGLMDGDNVIQLCDKIRYDKVPGLENGLALLLEYQVLKGCNDFIPFFVDQYPEWAMPAASALIIDIETNGIDQINRLLEHLTNNDLQVLSIVFQLVEYQNKNQLHAEMSKIVMKEILPNSIASFSLLSHCLKYASKDELLLFYQQLTSFLSNAVFHEVQIVTDLCLVMDKLAKEILRYTEKKIAFEIYQKAYEFSLSKMELKKLQFQLLGLIGQIKKSMGNAIEAITDYKDAIRGLMEVQEEELAAQNMLRLSEVFKQSGKTKEALELAKNSIEIVERKSGSNSLVFASAISYVSSIYIYRNEWSEALPNVERSMKIREKLLGEHNTKVCVNYVNYAIVLAQLGRPEDAKRYLHKALDIRVRKFGKKHQDVATTLHELAHVLNMEGNKLEAVATFNEALEIRLEKLGPSHFFTCKTMLSLIAVLRSDNLFSESEVFENKFLEAVQHMKTDTKILLEELTELQKKYPKI